MSVFSATGYRLQGLHTPGTLSRHSVVVEVRVPSLPDGLLHFLHRLNTPTFNLILNGVGCMCIVIKYVWSTGHVFHHSDHIILEKKQSEFVMPI